MPRSINDTNLTAYLTAYADAELDAERSAQLVSYLEEHPEALHLLREMHQLRAAARRMVRAQTPAVPDHLQKTIEEMARSAQSALPVPLPIDAPQPPRRVPKLIGIAAAVLVALGLGLVVGLQLGGGSSAEVAATEPDGSASVVPVSFVSEMLKTHVNCSRFPSHHTAEIPQELGALSEALKRDMTSQGPYPDLTALGFRVIGAGPCGKPLQNTVHILYAAIDPEQNETLSIFAQPVSERLKLEPAKLYTMTANNSPHPALVWRSGRITYFFVGDHHATVKRAQDILAADTRL